jgi:hypothetical protein
MTSDADNLVDQRPTLLRHPRRGRLPATRQVVWKNIDFAAKRRQCRPLFLEQLNIEDPQYGFRVVGRYISARSVVEFDTWEFTTGDKAAFRPERPLFAVFLPCRALAPNGRKPTRWTESVHERHAPQHRTVVRFGNSGNQLPTLLAGYTPRFGNAVGRLRYTKVNENFAFTQGSRREPPHTWTPPGS